ncbi:hypothetical protein ABRY94_11925 [Castellaniella ginsengisoli]|uniref:Uncharacterized protein n=1 Tax=Castellaniella ginsengisoli TaxID=546114 RepID=A0AB39ER21_9BURK
MKKNSRMSMFRRQAAMVVRERAYRLRQPFINTWEFWVARAYSWHAWQSLYKMESILGPNERPDTGEAFAYQDSLRAVETARIRRQAQRLNVSLPDDLFERVDLPFEGRSALCLTEEGEERVMPELQAAARKRRQDIAQWIALAIGLIGSLTGLVAILR